MQPDAEAVAVRAAQARVLHAAAVDAETMERNGVLLQVNDTVAQRSYRILAYSRAAAHAGAGLAFAGHHGRGAGEGKTLTAINLAISLARDVNTWVYLVDLDLQRPKVASYLGLQVRQRAERLPRRQARFDEILYSMGVERLGVIPNSQAMEYSSDLLGSPRLRELCQSSGG
jgi:protein-tyrosine kinase